MRRPVCRVHQKNLVEYVCVLECKALIQSAVSHIYLRLHPFFVSFARVLNRGQTKLYGIAHWPLSVERQTRTVTGGHRDPNRNCMTSQSLQWPLSVERQTRPITCGHRNGRSIIRCFMIWRLFKYARIFSRRRTHQMPCHYTVGHQICPNTMLRVKCTPAKPGVHEFYIIEKNSQVPTVGGV